MPCKFGITILLLTFVVAYSFAQEKQTLDSLAGNLVQHIRSSETEQLYLVTGKSIYTTEDAIWFRAFLLHSVSLKVSRKSKNVFVDLVNEQDSTVSKLILNASGFQLNGRLQLNDSIPTGYYWLRAYTMHMAQKEPEKAAVQPVYIVNNRINGSLPVNIPGDTLFNVSESNEVPQMHFFPEGGALMTGANCTVGLRIENAVHVPVSINGYIRENKDSIIAYFSSNKSGLAFFSFYPDRFRKYTAHIMWKGKDLSYPLPPFNFFAGQLAITEENGIKNIRVLLEDSIYKKDAITYIVGINRDSLCFAATGSGNYELILPQEKFPEGIATFYLFDAHKKLLSTRKFYFPHTTIITSTDKTVYSPREKVDLAIRMDNTENLSGRSSLAVAVADSALVVSQNTNQLINDFYIGNNPNAITDWQMAHAKDITKEERDLLMLCFPVSDRIDEGLVRTEWESPDDSLLYVKGKVLGFNHKPISNEVVTLISKAGNTVVATDTTKKDGSFVFPFKEYPDSTRFSLQTSRKNGVVNGYFIILDSLPFPSFHTPAFLKKRFYASPQSIAQFRNYYIDTSVVFNRKGYLKTVTVKTYRKKEVNYDESKRISQFSRIITSDQLEIGGYGVVTSALLMVPGVHMMGGYLFVGTPSGFSFSRSASDSSIAEPLVIVDGIEYTPTTLANFANYNERSRVMAFLNTLSPATIDFIEVLSGPEAATYGTRGANGVIVINSKSWKKLPGVANGIKNFVVRGYHVPSVFTVPDYNNPQVKKSKVPDHRSTLFWKGDTLIQPRASFSNSFYTSDVPAVYTITITGITEQGQPVFEQIPIKVND